jgi:hypothetical protein
MKPSVEQILLLIKDLDFSELKAMDTVIYRRMMLMQEEKLAEFEATQSYKVTTVSIYPKFNPFLTGC